MPDTQIRNWRMFKWSLHVKIWIFAGAGMCQIRWLIPLIIEYMFCISGLPFYASSRKWQKKQTASQTHDQKPWKCPKLANLLQVYVSCKRDENALSYHRAWTFHFSYSTDKLFECRTSAFFYYCNFLVFTNILDLILLFSILAFFPRTNSLFT